MFVLCHILLLSSTFLSRKECHIYTVKRCKYNIFYFEEHKFFVRNVDKTLHFVIPTGGPNCLHLYHYCIIYKLQSAGFIYQLHNIVWSSVTYIVVWPARPIPPLLFYDAEVYC